MSGCPGGPSCDSAAQKASGTWEVRTSKVIRSGFESRPRSVTGGTDAIHDEETV